MIGQDFKIIKMPNTPGVYFFKRGREVLYVGKATSLKERVKSYFSSDLIKARGLFLVDMVSQADLIDWQETDSVLEAVILEAELIKKYQPKYNTKEKDDKSFNCVVITIEDFPQILVVRKKDIDFSCLTANSSKPARTCRFGAGGLKAIFGPFPNGTQLKEALKIVRKIFPFRDSKCRAGQGRPCFNRQIGLCPGTCTGEISKAEYAKTIRNISLFFQGRKPSLIRVLEKDMRNFAEKQEFEKAGATRKTIFALNHIQDVALIKSDELAAKSSNLKASYRIEAYDIAHMSGKNMVGSMIVWADGELNKADYRKFKIGGFDQANDAGALREILTRRFSHPEWCFPNLIVVDGNEIQKNVATEVLRILGQKIPIVAVVKDKSHNALTFIGDLDLIDRHKKEIILANSEAHRFAISFYRALERKGLTG